MTGEVMFREQCNSIKEKNKKKSAFSNQYEWKQYKCDTAHMSYLLLLTNE